MKREEAIRIIETVFQDEYVYKYYDSITHQALNIAIEALKNEPILCEDCRHRNTWDNPRLDPQYYRCGKGVKFRDYGYVREDDYCPLGERREPLPQYEEWQDEFNKMCESARPKAFVADEWYRDTFKGEEE